MNNNHVPKQDNNEHKHQFIEYANGKSLEEINGSIEVPKGKGFGGLY